MGGGWWGGEGGGGGGVWAWGGGVLEGNWLGVLMGWDELRQAL